MSLLKNSVRLVLATFFLEFIFCWSPGKAAEPSNDLPPLPKIGELSGTEIRRQLSDLLKEEVSQRNAPGHAIVVLQICDLHAAVRSDKRFADSPVLQGVAATARSRLIGLGKDLTSQLKRDGISRPSDLDERLKKLARIEDPTTIEADPSGEFTFDDYPELGGTPPSSDNDNRGKGGAAPGPLLDNGWELVELIQRTVMPLYWETQGGPGVIRYDWMRRALVIRASSHIHEQVGGLLR